MKLPPVTSLLGHHLAHKGQTGFDTATLNRWTEFPLANLVSFQPCWNPWLSLESLLVTVETLMEMCAGCKSSVRAEIELSLIIFGLWGCLCKEWGYKPGCVLKELIWIECYKFIFFLATQVTYNRTYFKWPKSNDANDAKITPFNF